MKFKRLTLEKSRPMSGKRLNPKHKSGRVFQQSLLKSGTGSQDSITSKPPSESVSGSAYGSVSGSVIGSITGSVTGSASGSVSGTVTETATESKSAN